MQSQTTIRIGLVHFVNSKCNVYFCNPQIYMPRDMRLHIFAWSEMICARSSMPGWSLWIIHARSFMQDDLCEMIHHRWSMLDDLRWIISAKSSMGDHLGRYDLAHIISQRWLSPIRYVVSFPLCLIAYSLNEMARKLNKKLSNSMNLTKLFKSSFKTKSFCNIQSKQPYLQRVFNLKQTLFY